MDPEIIEAEHLDDRLAGAINDAIRLEPVGRDNNYWGLRNSALPPGLEVVNGEIVKLPGVIERRTLWWTQERNRLREFASDGSHSSRQHGRGTIGRN